MTICKGLIAIITIVLVAVNSLSPVLRPYILSMREPGSPLQRAFEVVLPRSSSSAKDHRWIDLDEDGTWTDHHLSKVRDFDDETAAAASSDRESASRAEKYWTDDVERPTIVRPTTRAKKEPMA